MSESCQKLHGLIEYMGLYIPVISYVDNFAGSASDVVSVC